MDPSCSCFPSAPRRFTWDLCAGPKQAEITYGTVCLMPSPAHILRDNVGPGLAQGSAIIKFYGEIIQDLPLFEGSGNTKNSEAQNDKDSKSY